MTTKTTVKPAKVHTFSYSIVVLIDAPNEASAKAAQAELKRLVQFSAGTTAGVWVGDDLIPVSICTDNRNDWTLEEIRDEYGEDGL